MANNSTVHFEKSDDGRLSASEAAELAEKALDSGRGVSSSTNAPNSSGKDEPLFEKDGRYDASEQS
jgi:hypothetical protein